MRLYQFRYRNEGERSRPHLGVIAERAPEAILSSDRRGVSLYDYVGLLAAGTQALDSGLAHERRRAADLEQELGALMDRVERLQRELRRLRER